MKVKYDREVDICLSNEPVAESDESKPEIIIDYSEEGNVVGIEILEGSKKTSLPDKLEYEVG